MPISDWRPIADIGINVTLCAEIFFFCKLSCLLYIFTAVWQPYLKNYFLPLNIFMGISSNQLLIPMRLDMPN